MDGSRFAALMLLVLAVLLLAMAVERYQACHEKDGVHCKLGQGER